MGRRGWRPHPIRPIDLATPATGFAYPPPAGRRADFKPVRELVRLELDGTYSPVQVTRPDAAGRFPVVVFGHGAGTGNHTAFDEHCTVLARRGVVGLVADKDLAAYSALRRDYGHIARQYAGLWRWGAAQPWADPGRIGYYGESEGAWIAPWSAGLTGAAFVVLASAPLVSPRQQGMYAMASHLTAAGGPAALLDAAQRLAGRTMPPGLLEYIDFDSGPHLERLGCPVLMAYGVADISMPIVQAARLAMAKVKGPVAVRYYADADHGLRRGPDRHVATAFLEDLAAWVIRPAASPIVAGARPRQDFAAVAPPPSGPIVGDALVAGAALAALAGSALAARGVGGERLPADAIGRAPAGSAVKAPPSGPSARARRPGRVRPMAPAGQAGAAYSDYSARAARAAQAAQAARRLGWSRAGALGALAAQAGYLWLVFRLAGKRRGAPVALRLGHAAVGALGAATAAAGASAAAATAAAVRAGAPRSGRLVLAALAGLGGASALLSLAANWGAFGRFGSPRRPNS